MLTLVVVGALACLLAPAAAPAGAQEAGAIDVVIEQLAPMLVEPDGTLTVSGVLVNVDDAPVDDVRLRLRVSSRPLAERAQVASVIEAGLSPEGGSPDDVPLPLTEVVVAASLAPGVQQPFALTVDVAGLGRTGGGVYALGVEALGRLPGQGQARQGVERTLLPLSIEEGVSAPLGLAWLWPLADRPGRDAAGVFLTDATPASLATGGRLHGLLALGTQHADAITWVADPELLQAATDIADGYLVADGDGTVVGDQDQAAGQWLADLRAATADVPVHVVPYADVDAAAARRAGLPEDVIRSATQAEPVAEAALGRPVTDGLAWAPTGRFDKQTANLLADAGVSTVILAGSAMPTKDGAGASGISDYGTVLGPITAVLRDDGLSAVAATAPATTAGLVQERQRFLAESALAAQAAEPGTVLAIGPRDLRWQPSTALLEQLLTATEQAAWLRPTTLAELRAAPRAPRTRLPYGERSRESELPPAFMSQVARTAGRIESLGAILDDPAPVTAPFTAALLRAQSTAWRADVPAGRDLLQRINGEITGRVEQVRVLSTGTVTFSGDAGRVPVTIANDSDQPVTVGLALVGSPAARLVSEPVTGITVDPGRKVSVEMEARVLGGEPLDVRVQLLTGRGDPYGKPAVIVLTSTAYARAAAWVMGVAFAGIAVFVVVGIARRVRTARASHMAR